MIRNRTVFAILTLTALLLPAITQAHPHAWIDLRIDFQRDADGQITHMLHHWRFDPTYGQYLYDDAQQHQSGDTPEARLQGLADEILDNLDEYAWYTHLRVADESLAIAAASDPSMEMDAGLLHFRFRLELERPVDPAATPLEYRIYDPTYFIEILHQEPHGTRILSASGLADATCRAELVRPRPDPALVARALALDYGASVDYDLGQHFAERVTVRCE
ncbi:DUF1007 family protein [Thioalkalivibrio sp. ALJ16]|uniref:DUF1007 family protein n=1 Tax=Thioalkalivibrio sp. ALJ16 TaxID=1158762 RepID=UPI00035E45CE|nr:DUF1007 family protein [Thioalkalivibrio sp. ALJ16]